VVNLMPLSLYPVVKELVVPIEKEAECAPQPVWTLGGI
jgi:hypothetical protein